jgi:cytochrome c biogenesis protein CcmG, thiol:disulfide interchange protein DsbE
MPFAQVPARRPLPGAPWHNANVMKRTFFAIVAACALQPSPAPAVEAGQPAPAFSLPTAAGETVALESLRGKVVYVDFWASWCGPCKRSFPWMNELQEKFGARGFAVVAVNVDRRREDARRFLDAVPARFTVVYDPEGRTPAAYAVPGMPTSYLVDARGNVVFVEQGFRDESRAELLERIRRALAKGD